MIPIYNKHLDPLIYFLIFKSDMQWDTEFLYDENRCCKNFIYSGRYYHMILS